jgi:hypothetical protein
MEPSEAVVDDALEATAGRAAAHREDALTSASAHPYLRARFTAE